MYTMLIGGQVSHYSLHESVCHVKQAHNPCLVCIRSAIQLYKTLLFMATSRKAEKSAISLASTRRLDCRLDLVGE